MRRFAVGGNNRTRTYDPLLVRQMLSQLSYAPKCVASLSDLIIIPHDSRFVKAFFILYLLILYFITPIFNTVFKSMEMYISCLISPVGSLTIQWFYAKMKLVAGKESESAKLQLPDRNPDIAIKDGNYDTSQREDFFVYSLPCQY